MNIVAPPQLAPEALALINARVVERGEYKSFGERFPNTARFAAAEARIKTLCEFMEFLEGRGVRLCGESGEPGYSFEMLYEHFGIDTDACNAERDDAIEFIAREESAVREMFETGSMAKLEIDLLAGIRPERAPETPGATTKPRFRGIHSDALVAVLVPVLMRPKNVAPLLDSFHRSLARSKARANLYFLVGQDDRIELDALIEHEAQYFIVPPEHRSWAKKINDGYKRSHEPWLLCLGDDVEFHTGWLEEVQKVMTECPSAGVIGTNDLGNAATIEGRSSTHPLVSRAYADSPGGCIDAGPGSVLFEGYHHNFPDTELVATARSRGRYAHAFHAFIEHLHPLWGKSADDEVYKLGQSRQPEDQALFMSRAKKFGWTL